MSFLGVAAVVLPSWVSHSSPPSTSTKPSPVTASNLTRELNSSAEKSATLHRHLARSIGCCPCGRRHLLGASAAAVLLPIPPWKEANSSAFESHGFVQKFRPARPDWYDELYARAMDEGMRTYEAKVAGYKADLFSHLTETTKKILELGVGTGPNFKYYPRAADFHVVGIDPNKQMEKYARGAALASGLPQMKFTFMQGVGEYLPVEDGSFDAVIGTLVLCSVKDVNRTLQEVRRVLKTGGSYFFIEHVAAPGGSLLHFTQNILDPLQQFLADGCHLTRDTGEQISDAGFSSLNLNMTSVPTVSIISPHVYGIACKLLQQLLRTSGRGSSYF